MTARGKGGNVLSVTEMEDLQSQRQELEQSLKEGEGYGEGRVDQAVVKRQIAQLNQAIVDGKPGKLTGVQKDGLAKEAEELEAKFLEGLPSKYEMDHPAKCPGAVKKHMKWLQRFENTGLVNRYRTIQRTLNPGEEKSIESLRKDR